MELDNRTFYNSLGLVYNSLDYEPIPLSYLGFNCFNLFPSQSPTSKVGTPPNSKKKQYNAENTRNAINVGIIAKPQKQCACNDTDYQQAENDNNAKIFFKRAKSR